MVNILFSIVAQSDFQIKVNKEKGIKNQVE